MSEMRIPVALNVTNKIIERGSKRWLSDVGDGFALDMDKLRDDILYEVEQLCLGAKDRCDELEKQLRLADELAKAVKREVVLSVNIDDAYKAYESARKK